MKPFLSHFSVMLVSCILAGLMTTMNLWIDKWEDFQFGVNEIYMVGAMTGFMFMFMGLLSINFKYFIYGLIVALIFVVFIRKQIFVCEKQFLRTMIPNRSMALMMSKHLEKKPNNIQHLIDQIVQSQEKEIIIMKNYLGY